MGEINSSLQSKLAWDKFHLWHPYTSTIDPLDVYPVESAKGCRIRLADGRELIDGMSSWWAAIHGYSHPYIVQQMQAQTAKLSHIMFGGFTHEAAISLGQGLVQNVLPKGLDMLFYADSGSVAVEVAMKMALQYQQSLGKEKSKFAALSSAYHGDTWHAMSVCDPITGMHGIFSGALSPQYFLPQPGIKYNETWHDDAIKPLDSLLQEKADEIAALILEPIVQGAGGMYFYHPQYINKARELCTKHGVLLIFDEIATGFGRTGKMLGTDHTVVRPDIICIGKALTGGYLTLSCTATSREIADTICNGTAQCFMHGPTFMANPLACTAGLASLHLLINSPWEERTKTLQSLMQKAFSPLADLDTVHEVRCLGAIGVIEMKKAVNMKQLIPLFVKEGIWIRPFGKLIYVMPPFCAIADDEMEQLNNGVVNVVKSIRP